MEIADGVYSIRQTGRNAYPSGYSQAYLLDDREAGLTLIDTLADPDAHLVLGQLKRLGWPEKRLERILLTHGHRSHVGGLATLKGLSGATVHSHIWEADIIAGKRKAQPVSLRPIPPLRTYTQRLGLALGVGHPPCPVDEYLVDKQEVGPVRVVHTPGHTPGHVVFYWPERRALFTGDNIVTWPRLGAGWPSFQLDEMQFRDSLRYMEKSVGDIAEERLEPSDPPVEVIGVAHGEPITRGAAKRMRTLIRNLDR
jgi:glyoxylase-like metal-dependent hydrolase (beta-lactamase superfamily II)